MTPRIQSRLSFLAAAFLFFLCITLTLSPAGRERSWDVEYRWAHWIAFSVWIPAIWGIHQASLKHLGEHDPYLIPAAGLLSGWGLVTIWRLDPTFGLRQTAWFAISSLALVLVLRSSKSLVVIRRYKYLLLTGGLLLTSLTLIFGTNPLGIGPRLWLGCCGLYFQPSEPLKLLLVIYLAAYLADRHFAGLSSTSLLLPSLALTGIALLLLVIQRDLGTASIFIILYSIILYFVSGSLRSLLGAGVVILGSLTLGYFSIDIVHNRLATWLNPWVDPSGSSYQIVQSLLAIANGGLFGRGIGLGNPLLVPVSISDFIFSAIAEEHGLAGIIGLLSAILLITARGIVIAMRAPDRFRRILAIGVVIYLGAQSLLIIGGNLRLVPLTGVTLPFLSYGGSSLVTAYLALGILLLTSTSGDREPASLDGSNRFSFVAGSLVLGMILVALASAWWILVRGPDLLARTDNARRAIADRYVLRGSILDRNNQPINNTQGEVGSFRRVYQYPELGPVIGYTHPIFGQAGFESILDPYLRGYQGNPALTIWWEHLLFGTPPPGLDVRTSLDLTLQREADALLGETPGAILLMNAVNGEVLAMASHPTFDPNQLDQIGETLATEPASPLINRAVQGSYPVGDALHPLLIARLGTQDVPAEERALFYSEMGLDEGADTAGSFTGNIRASPQEIASLAAALSNHGLGAAPRIPLAVKTPGQGWVILPFEDAGRRVLEPHQADAAARALIPTGEAYWFSITRVQTDAIATTWLLAGTPPDWGGTPLVLVAALEEDNIPLAKRILSGLLTE